MQTIGKMIIGGVISAVMATSAVAGDTGQIEVNLEGLRANAGPLYISVQTEADYMSQTGEAGGIYKTDQASTYTYDVPAGDYAVSIWHDIDKDGKFSMNEQWIPTDGWGVSGNADMRTKPSFEDIKVSVASGKVTSAITMIYPK